MDDDGDYDGLRHLDLEGARVKLARPVEVFHAAGGVDAGDEFRVLAPEIVGPAQAPMPEVSADNRCANHMSASFSSTVFWRSRALRLGKSTLSRSWS